VVIEKLEISLQSTFNVEVVKIFKDQLVSSPIHLVIERLDSEFYFHEGNVKFSKLDVKIGEIDLKFNNFFFKIIYKIAKGLIINSISSAVSKVHNKIEDSLNKFISSQMLFDVGMGIGINATNVDRPRLVSYNKTGANHHVLKTEKNKFLEFLADEKNTYTSSILEFGIHAALYPNAAPDVHPNIEEAAEMDYIPKTFNNDITLLISDYTMNTLLFMIQQTGAMKYVFSNDTNAILPFSIDTQSLGNFIPNLTQKYPENKLCELKLYISALDHSQPKLMSDYDGSVITLNFGIDLNVFNSSDPWEDPNKELSLNATAHVKTQYLFTEGKLNVIVFRTVVDELNKKFDGLDVPEDLLKLSFDGLLNDLLKLYKPKLSGIDVIEKIESLLKAKVNNFMILTEQKYTVFSVNVEEL
jgi:hypothetical protein